jgi:hypothetical protein
MPLRYLLDEDLRGVLWRYIVRHNARGADLIDIVRVGDFDDLPLGTKDPEILIWCELNDRILVSHDKSTSPVHVRDHLAAGRHCPGILVVRDVHPVAVVEFLATAAHASEPEEWADRYFYIP